MSQFFYQLTPDQSITKLKSHLRNGLSQQEAQKRLAAHGPNKLRAEKKRPVIFKFFDQFRDLMIIVLIVAAVLAFYLKDSRGGIILLLIVVINACIGFYQEFKADKILDSLKQMVRTYAIVLRDGQKTEVESEQLVPGDIVYLEEGSLVPADIRLLETMHFSTNDFILTGESVPQSKQADLLFKKSVTLTDQDNCVFLATSVAKGNAWGVVFGTGMNTAIGRIANTTQKIKQSLSPLQIEMNALAKMLTKIAVFVALTLFVINFLLSLDTGAPLMDTVQLSLLFAIGVAAASIPQGMPAQVSVALSLGVGRLAQKKAIVKKLSSVETLGSTTVICSDKTGTITKNEMTIMDCWLPGRCFKVTGEGYAPKGAIFNEAGNKVSKHILTGLKPFFEDGFLASNGRVNPPDQEHKGWYALGDPTEAAFMTLAIKAGLDPDRLENRFPRLAELPFDSDRKRMTIVRVHRGRVIGYMKGGVESVLSVCSYVNEGGEIIRLTPKKRLQILEAAQRYSEQALRVIGLAYRDLLKGDDHFSIKKTEKSFVFSGFVTMMDPPRHGVVEAIKVAYEAHIKVLMITGDNAVTASAIADRIGMHNGLEGLVVKTGDQIKYMTDHQLTQLFQHQSVVFARTSPNDKYRIVTLLKKAGHVVAVTGDGVNDTLSLKQSDIGVAMGKMGSEVAKEASEIVLLDDNFSTLVRAIKEGRTIFGNLKKTILSSITSNNGELTCVLLGFIGMAFGLPAPITAVQILATDLLGEMLPLTALTFDPPEKAIMTAEPRNIRQHIVNKKSLLNLIFYGFWMGGAAYFSFVMVYKFGSGTIPSAQAAAYSTIIICQFINILSRRTERSIFTGYFFTNVQLWISILLSVVAVGSIIYIPALAVWFHFGPLGLHDWIYPVAGSLVFLEWQELRKLLKNWQGWWQGRGAAEAQNS